MHNGLPHAKSPDKVPALRLRTIEEAGKLSIAFTTGILIGIGETMEERVDSLLAIRTLHEKYGTFRKSIIQNSAPSRKISHGRDPEPSLEDMLRTISLARLILGPHMKHPSPAEPELRRFPSSAEAASTTGAAFSPVTKDFINPKAAWPQIARLQAETESAASFARTPGALPEFVRREEFLSPRVRDRVGPIRRGTEFA